jgi:hypothetical protein
LEVALALLLGVHLLLVDVAMAGPLACVWLEWRATRRSDDVAGRTGLALARLANWALSLGIVAGGVLLAARWLAGDVRYFDAVAAIPPSRLWFAGAELLFYFACMGAYVGLWNRWRGWRLAHRFLAIAAATNLLIHFPALFSIISVVSNRPELLGQPLDSAGFRALLVDGEVLSRVVHVWMASLAVTGAAVMWLTARQARGDADRAAADRLVRHGALLALVPTLAQIPVGFWLTVELPESLRRPLMGGDWLATALFATSLLLALLLMHRLASIALGDQKARHVRSSIALMCGLVLLMVGTR